MMAFIIYPPIACWVWNADKGWLFERGYHDFAGSSVIHLFGGLCGLILCIFVGPRINRFKGEPQFPCLFRKARKLSKQRYE
jgi:Amt family ammonium transporter